MAEWPKKVRTTMLPDVDVEVGPQEYVDLHRQGLLVTDTKTAAKEADKTAAAVVAGQTGE